MFRRSIAFAACAVAVLWAFATGAGARTAQAQVVRTTVIVAGKPFFPIMLIDECAAGDVARARTLGINLILNESCKGSAPDVQLRRLSGRELGVLPIRDRGATGLRLAGWTYPDEPENNGWTPAKLAGAFPYRRGSDDGLVSFVTTTSAFYRAPFRDPKVSPGTTRDFARLADVAGFDLYPLNHCQSDLGMVYDAQRTFIRLVGPMPTFQWIETGALIPSYCGGFSVSAQQLTAEAWLAVAGGARGIGFFTHTLEPDREFDVSPPVAHAMWEFANLAFESRPGLVGTTLPTSSNSAAVKVLGRAAGARTYVFAVNAEPQWVKVQLTVPRLEDGPARVVGEGRSVTVSGHSVVDTFAPLAVHVYLQGG